MKYVVRALGDLGAAITLAPERHRAAALEEAGGVPLGDLVVERTERVVGEALAHAVVLDTTHARDGVLDVPAALRATAPPSSAKKAVHAGDLLVSRLRPYLRQIAYAHPSAIAAARGRDVACSTEFYVLAAREGEGSSIAYLVPWLLGAAAQSILAAAQEGGHHPRVAREVLLAMRVPQSVVDGRDASAAAVEAALERVYVAHDGWSAVLDEAQRPQRSVKSARTSR